jgi:hypothetical protein
MYLRRARVVCRSFAAALANLWTVFHNIALNVANKPSPKATSLALFPRFCGVLARSYSRAPGVPCFVFEVAFPFGGAKKWQRAQAQ